MDAALVGDPFFYAVAIPAVLLVGISKGGFGGGLGMIGVPLIALAVPLVQAAAILLPILCLMDLFALRAYWGVFSGPNVRVLLPASILGIGIGVWTFGSLDERSVRGVVGTVAVVFALYYWVGLWKRGGIEEAPRSPGTSSALVWGTVTGFTSTVAHAGGPPMSVHLLPQRLERGVYVGTTVVLFTVINLVKLGPYAWLDQLPPANLAMSAVLAPLAPLGIWLGRWLHHRIDDRPFYWIAYAMLLLVGAKLIADAAGLGSPGGG